MIRLYVRSTEEILLLLVFVMSEFCYEVCNDLPFDGGSRAILDVELAQFYGPECQLSNSVKVAHCLS